MAQKKQAQAVEQPIFGRQLRIWAVVLLFFGICLYVLSGILLPFIAGMALAYFLDPVADWLERHGASRMFATVLILIVFALVFILTIVALVPVLVKQFAAFAAALPGLIDGLQELIARVPTAWITKYFNFDTAGTDGQLSEVLSTGGAWLKDIIGSVLSGGLALINVAALLVVTPVVAFYLLLDWDRMVATIDDWLPREHVDTIRAIMADIDSAMAGFIRGQGTVCLLLGLFYAIGLSLLGLNFGLLIGFGAGFISFIPYVGSIVGLVAAMTVALVQFWPDYVMVGAVAVVFFAGQFIEGNILQPKLVGGHVGLHPVWLMFALFAFGSLFGFVGMLLAVPIAAAIGVVARFGLKRYLNSSLYSGEG